MPNSPTIVSAALSDKELQDSINRMVANFDKGLQTMLEHSNEYVGKIQESLQKIGNTNFGAKGSNDGGVAKQTKQHKDLTEAVTKETQKLQDLQQSLSGASDREQNFISQKERAANTIAQENELLNKQQSELAALKAQEQQLADAHQKDMQSRQQNAAAIEKQRGAVKYYEEEIVSLQARLTSAQAKIDRFYEVQAKARESISSRLHAPSDQFIGYNDYERGKSVYSKTEQDVRSLIKALSELDNADKKHGFGDELRRAYMNLTPSQDMANVFKRQQEEISSYIKTLQEAKKGTKGETRANLDNQIAAAKELLTIYKELGNAQNSLNKTVQKEGLRDGGNISGIKRDIEETQKAYGIAKQKLDELTQSSQKSNQIRQESLNVAAKIIEKDEEISKTRARIAAATKEQSDAEKNARQEAKEKTNIQSQIANQEKQVAEAKKQLTTATQQHTEAETKSSRATKEKTMTLDQQASAINTAVQSQKKYTDEILRQAAAIRATKEWQEKGYVLFGDVNYYDKERANVSKRDKQLLLSLEEQIVQAQQKEAQEALVVAEAKRQQAQAAKEAANTIKSVSYKTDLQMSLSGFGVKYTQDVTNEQVKQYQTLEEQLQKLKTSYALMNEEAKKSEQGLGISKSISELQRQRTELLQSIAQQISKKRTSAATDQFSSLRQSISSVLDVQSKNVRLFDAEKASSEQLSKELKLLQSAYSKLSASRIAKGDGTAIADEIQRVQRALQKLQATQTRPTSLKNVMGLDEKTLDDMAYKLRQLQSYKMGLDVVTQKDEISRVSVEYDKLKRKMDELMGKNQQMIASNTALGRSWNYMKNRLAFYFTVGASTQFVKNLIEVRSQYEMNEKALGILLDSASRGTRIFNELSQMALVSPYTLIELSNAAKQLTAYDIAAKDVVDTTRRLADVASAVGVPVERLTYALGQIKAYGYLNSRDARMFANAGIPLVKQLADRYSELEGKMVSTADVYDRMKKKAIDYNDVMAVINKMTDEGGKFFDFQAKMAETLKVRLANLTLAWNNMLNDIGKDNQGVMTTGLKGLTVMFKHWRELYRIISTAITALGAYKVATIIAGMATKTSIGGSAVTSWFALARGVKGAKDAVALFSLTLKSIPFTAWFTAIATLASYFILFNNSSDDVKQKLEDIKSAFDGVRKEIETLFADAIKTDNIGSQLTKLRDMLELAETELGVTIPIRLEDVNESNIKQKLKEAKQFIDDYINFSQTFSEAAAGTKFNELMNDFGSKARSVYTNVSESINSVVVALKELSDKGQASKRDIEILNELTSGQKDDESRIEYLQRLIKLYEELGLIGQKRVEPMIEHNLFKAYFTSTWDNVEELEQQQEKALDRLGVKNKEVFANMLTDVQDYYSSSSISAYQMEQQVMRVAKKIDINNIPVEQRTMKLTAAINEEASQNNWNQFEKEFARQVANEKFGTTIEISDESKKAAEEDLQAWQRNIQNWAKNNGITFDVSFQTNDTEASYAKRMLQEAKDAKELWETLGRKEKQGTGSKDATTNAYNDYIERRKLAAAAGADLSSLDAKSRKAASKAESELAKALKDELSTIDKVRSIYKDLTKEGMSHANAVERATRGWDETVNAINRVLQKNGLQKLDLSKFAGIENPRELLNILQSQLETLVKRGASTSEIRVLQTKIHTVSVEADKYDLTMITKGLNNELDKLKDEYELAVELDANPELGNMFANMMGINLDTLPRTVSEYGKRYTDALNKYLKEKNQGLELEHLFLTNDDLSAFKEMVKQQKLSQEAYDLIAKAVEDLRGKEKKFIQETRKEYESLIKKYGEYQAKIEEVQNTTDKERLSFVKKFSKENYIKAIQLVTEIQETEDPAKKEERRQQLANLVKQLAQGDETRIKLQVAIDKMNLQELARVDFEQFQKSPEWITATGDLAALSSKAIKTLISDLEEYKKSASNLSPKQIKNLNNALKNLYKEQRKNNPFASIKNMMEEAKNAAANYQEEIDDVHKKMNELRDKEKKQGGFLSPKDSKTLGELIKRFDELKKKQDEALNPDATQWVSAINSTIGALQTAIEFADEFVRTLDGAKETDIDEIFSVINKGGQGAAMGAQLSGGNGYAALVGGVLGAEMGLVQALEEKSNKEISDEVEKSENRVHSLELAYKDLQWAIEDAYGAQKYGAMQVAAANRMLQLEELKRQLALEKSRNEKNKDYDRIRSLESEIKELEHEIAQVTDDIVNDLLGITSVGDAAENLVSSMITAFRKGEDYMKEFQTSFDDMINNMIMKAIVSRLIGDKLEEIFDNIKKKAEERTVNERKAVTDRQRELAETNATIEDIDRRYDAIEKSWAIGSRDKANILQSLTQAKEELKIRKELLEKGLKNAEKEYDKALEPTPEDVEELRNEGKLMTEGLKEEAKALFEAFGLTFGMDSTKTLSGLKAGISQISETTAESLEAYMNGVSQQVYYQSDLLTQIRDTVMSFDLDVQLGVFSQMLLQLQNNYIVMQSMLSMMENWTVPSGSGIRVELLS